MNKKSFLIAIIFFTANINNNLQSEENHVWFLSIVPTAAVIYSFLESASLHNKIIDCGDQVGNGTSTCINDLSYSSSQIVLTTCITAACVLVYFGANLFGDLRRRCKRRRVQVAPLN